ncbi:MAG: DNA repair protein RadA [Magnetococcus sp. DMHC-6]
MAQEKKSFVCTDCGAEHVRWEGKCNTCGAWNSLKSFLVKSTKIGTIPLLIETQPVKLASMEQMAQTRIGMGFAELDRVLGGGLVLGSVVLLGGDPGIGKSTLLMQALGRLSQSMNVLYVSGEESLGQLKLRAERLETISDGFYALMENRLESILNTVKNHAPEVLVVDSIQTVASDALPAGAGTVSQVRECAHRLIQLAKQHNLPLFLVGHVTKDGQIAGPRVVEHMVDTVLYFEGERGHNYRVLRAVKNRFGAANEIGVFEMRESGLIEVHNPSELFLSERTQEATGSVVFAGIEGTRPVLVEIQALVAPSPLVQPRRTTLGLDVNRLAMITAVLEKSIGLGLFNHDIFLNVAGGFRITEPAADLAVAAALFASHQGVTVDRGMVILGEVGLSGEIRAVGQVGVRLKESAKLGFTRALIPYRSLDGVPSGLAMAVDGIKTVRDAMERII